jgi:hypothetical protein
MVLRIPVAVVIAALSLVAAGPVRAQQNPPPTLADPSAFVLEQSYSRFTDQVLAPYATALGLDGKGVTIALPDTGIMSTHREFSSTGKRATGYNAVDGSNDDSHK